MRGNTPDYLRELLPSHEDEGERGLPPLLDADYRPYARPANRPLYAIHFLFPHGDTRSFQYVHLDSDSRFTGHEITLRFLGFKPIQVVIRGRNLWELYDYIHQHRVAWIRQAARDFARDEDAIVTGISVAEIDNPGGGY